MSVPADAQTPSVSGAPTPETELIGPLDPEDLVEFTVLLRRISEIPDELTYGPATVSGEEFAARFGARAEDVELVSSTLVSAGARILEQHPAARRIRTVATASAVQSLFGVALHLARSPHPQTGLPVEHRTSTGDFGLPSGWDEAVIAIVGLDNRPIARSGIAAAPADAESVTPYYPAQLADIYGFPPNTDGAGHTVAIVEFGGGIIGHDLTAYFDERGNGAPHVRSHCVDRAVAKPDPPPQTPILTPTGEVMLDIEIVGALAPKARQEVYFAPRTPQGFIDGLSAAIHGTPIPTVVSVSWGAPEEHWLDKNFKTLGGMEEVLDDAPPLGVTVLFATGDGGSSAGQPKQQHVWYPAASPMVLAVGGTKLRADPATGAVQSETVWNTGPDHGATGGGVSTIFVVPDWQQTAGVPNNVDANQPGRGVPDVAADADPCTGYRVRFYNAPQLVGGTSAATPLWAALLCRYSQLLGVKFGLLQPIIYAGATPGRQAPGFRAVVSGNNGAYSAREGWNPCTGLGVPIGPDLERVLRAHTALHKPTTTPPQR